MKPAGLGIRFCAGTIDLVGVILPVILAGKVLALLGKYLPIELASIASYALYTSVGVAWTGRTIGKWMCGLAVQSVVGRRPGVLSASIRALIVAASQVLLGLPLLSVGLRRSKRGLHDCLARTRVVLVPGGRSRRRTAVTVVFGALLFCVAAWGTNFYVLWKVHRGWVSGADRAADGKSQPGTPLVEASEIDPILKKEMSDWLKASARDPAEALIEAASRHQITIVGELHGKKQSLAFFNKAIPALYHQGGVRVIALECCHPDQDSALRRLATGTEYDSDLALDIARNAIWRSWGWKGYWDVLETVWRLNRSLPPSGEPLEVVGISPWFDLQSFALVKSGPWVEKLRVVRLISRLPQLIYHDAYYAREVERAAVKRGKRTVVWVGASHALLDASTEREGDGAVRRTHRMGSMLCGRYGDLIGQAILHNSYQHGEIAHLIEDCAGSLLLSGLAFVPRDSPFASLRDRGTWLYARAPARGFSDKASLYVVLAAEKDMEACDWVDGFLTERMFGWNKPFYEMLFGRTVKDFREADREMEEGIHHL